MYRVRLNPKLPHDGRLCLCEIEVMKVEQELVGIAQQQSSRFSRLFRLEELNHTT